jgi:dolichyl-phosphate-mannose-protein mannosyltransferase
MDRLDAPFPRRIHLALCALLVTLVSFFTYVRAYDQPAALFWDENYHISSAQRYLNKVYFLEPHPPLGKLFIALGEHLLSPNERNDQFVDVEYGVGEKLPQGFSFAGYRLFPTLFAWLTAPMLFLVATTVTGSLWAGLLVSALYTFDNASIVHARAAMLESTQLFFVTLALLAFFTLAKRKLSRPILLSVSGLLGLAIAAVIATKVNGLLLILLLPLIFVLNNLSAKTRTLSLLVASISCLCVYFGIWRIHFMLGERRLEQLSDSGYFSMAPDVRAIIDAHQQTHLAALPRLWWENGVTYVSRYADGVPKLDLSKNDENGSPPFIWPFGARTIQYRWEAAPQNSVKYLFLVSNPFGWALALGGVILSGCLLIARLVFPSSVRLKSPLALVVLLGLYCGYLFGMSQISRVLYLYHYFVALIFGFLLIGIAMIEVDHVGPFKITPGRKICSIALCIALTFLSFLWYSPLTYYEPLTDHQVRSRSILSLWDLTCAGCPRTNKLVKTSSPIILSARFGINELPPEDIHQDWGQPQIGLSATGRPLIAQGIEYPTAFGVHSNYMASYPVYRYYSRLSGDVGLPDYLKNSKASVTFQVIGDDIVLWESPVIKPGEPLRHIDVDVSEVDLLVLKTLDGGDGITDDHGFWANLALTRKPEEEAPLETRAEQPGTPPATITSPLP